MSSFQTVVVNFIGADMILQGTDWIREVQFVDDTGAPVNMTVYQPSNGGVTRGMVKSEDLATTYFKTSNGTLVLTWKDASTLQLKVTATASAAIASSSAASPRIITNSATYQIEGTQGAGGLVDRLLQGRIEMDQEVATEAT